MSDQNRKLSYELFDSGVLNKDERYNRPREPIFEPKPERPHVPEQDPVSKLLDRRQRSLKISPRGWKTITQALRSV